MSAARILVVDDEESMRITLAANLELEGHEVVEAASGEEALEQVRQRPVDDVCVVDLVMPGMTGPEVVERLRSVGRPVAVIAVSGHNVPEMMRQVAALGDVACLRKPISIRELAQTIARTRGRALARS